MIRVAHLIPFLAVGGVEQMVLQLCRFHDRHRFECVVGVPNGGVIADEIRETGTPVYVGPSAFADAARCADVINLHWCDYSPSILSQVLATGKPFLTTLHGNAVLPRIPALTICVSKHTYDCQVHTDRSVFISNGVDLSQFAPHARSQRDRIVITRVCRPSKCAMYFWEAARYVLDRHPKTELWIVGCGERNDRGSGRIRLLGVRRDVAGILAATDIFVYTPYPNYGCNDLVVMEAAAAGVPCVVSDVNAVRESVLDGKTGYLTPFGDAAAVVDRVSELVQNTRLRSKMGSAAAEMARERFDMNDVARRYETVFRIVLDGHREQQRSIDPRFVARSVGDALRPSSILVVLSRLGLPGRPD
jgi:glycosyltransferase involved in cell wall biosynthesis